MAKHEDLLIEIGTEELPPKALQRLESSFAAGIRDGLTAVDLKPLNLESFATPRRLAVLIRELPDCQPTQLIDRRGPPVKVAYDEDGKPTRAAEAFAKGCGVTVEQLDRHKTAKGEWLAYRAEQPGEATTNLLPAIIDAALAALPIPKRMRWGNHEAEFVRPVHWVLVRFGPAVVDATILGVASGSTTRGHRFHAPGAIEIDTPSNYRERLRHEGKVIADFSERRERIVQLANETAVAVGGEAILEPAVVDEVTALVEWPAPVPGRFGEEFLRLPEEVLISTLQDHQRYFPVRASDGALMPHFIAISNLDSKDPEQVRLGNERVVQPRLADAAFFFDQDCRTTLDARRARLADVVFERQLGSLLDKSKRVAELAESLAAALNADPAATRRAAMLGKADLLSEMVGEFPELQGRMGYHYALHDGEDPAVAVAIEEQYWPRQAGTQLPETPAGRALALADRLDTVAGIFAIGKRPSGNKDPFGLRRSALGVLRILIEQNIEIDLRDALQRALALQPVQIKNQEKVLAELYDFFMDRLRTWYLDGLAPGFQASDITPEMFEAVRARAPGSPLDFHQRLTAVHAFLGLDAAASLAAANKRIANILRTADGGSDTVNAELFDADAERRLYEAVRELLPAHRDGLSQRDYTGVLLKLANLREPVDAFFDDVMVMCEDEARRQNRVGQLSQLRRLFLDVADLSFIQVN